MIGTARITDRYVLTRLEQVRKKSGESSITKTAGRLLIERIAQLELKDVPTMADQTHGPSARPTAVG